ncbi:B12-binding domain-containing radical SAM protein [Candidatus Woesearchaeota archaeon]|nr:B12-binding domain-containing radical SAM protein [Candidatus Woesearchaeota archaeon]
MSKEILLVQPKAGAWENLGIRPPDGLLTIAAIPSQRGYNVKIVDLRVESDWKSVMKQHLEKSPLFVATSCMTGPQIGYALELSKFVKQHDKNIPVIWGGVHPTFNPHQTLENENIDIVVIDEGDLTFVELIEKIGKGESLKDVLGIGYKEHGKITINPRRPLIEDLDSLPNLPYELIDTKRYYGFDTDDDSASIAFSTSRGCPFKCTFCYDTNFFGNRFRAYSAKRTIEIVKNVVEKFKIRNIYFADDNFCTNLKRYRDIVDMLLQENLDIRWGISGVRMDTLQIMDHDLLSKTVKAGCTNLNSGVESGSERVLKLIRKGITVQQVVDTNKKLGQYPFKVKYTLISGFPTETEDEVKETVNLALRMVKDNKNAYTSFSVYCPYPGVELWNIAKQHGVYEPKSLEEWINFNQDSVFDNLPWLDSKRKNMIKNLVFTSNFANKNIKYKIGKKYLKLLFDLYYPVAKLRFKYNIYQFPVDRLMANSIANALY